MKMTVKGLQEAQKGFAKHMVAFKPRGLLENVIWLGTIQAHRFAVAFTHVLTGALRAAHIQQMESGWGGPRGRVFINPAASSIVRVRGGSSTTLHATGPATYGPYEHRRGGSHAFYERVQNERGASVGRMMAYELVNGWQRGQS